MMVDCRILRCLLIHSLQRVLNHSKSIFNDKIELGSCIIKGIQCKIVEIQPPVQKIETIAISVGIHCK